VAGWLHTEINVRHRELNPDTVAHLSTNRARRRLNFLIEANALTNALTLYLKTVSCVVSLMYKFFKALVRPHKFCDVF